MPAPRPSCKVRLLALLFGLAAPIPATAGDTLTIPFAAGAATLDADTRDVLDGVAGRLAADGALRLRVVAYAAPAAGDGARRLSLARARAVWLRLTGLGVPTDRIAIRALGDRVPEGTPDRLDVFVERQ